MTPQQIEALKLALEALQFALQIGFDESSESQIKKGDKAGQQHRKAITAIKEALAEHAMQEVQRLGQEIEQKIGCVNHDCDQCKAQPEQEPINDGWQITFANGHSGFGVYAHMDEYPEEGSILLCAVPQWAKDALKATTTPPCPTCEALARTVMMDQTGRDA